MADEYKSVQTMLEEIAGEKLTDDTLNQTLDLYNERNALMREFCKICEDHLDIITPLNRHNVMKAMTFLSIDDGMKITKKLIDALKKAPKFDWQGKKAVLTGITAEPDEFLNIFEENHVAVVADDLAQESRQYRTDYPKAATPLMRMAQQWLDIPCCSTVYSEDKLARGKYLLKLAQETSADCIAVCLMRFCDVEEYDYPYISRMAEEAGLYCLCLEIDQSTQDNGQSKTKIQSYAEI